jgi:hypothetical protein
MDYYVTKQDSRNEWRIYLNDEVSTKDQILYRGHKLGLEPKDMINFLEYRKEKSTGKFFLLNYEILKDTPDTTDSSMWFVGVENTIDRMVIDSWKSLEKKIANDGKKFRKITITKAYI